MSLAWLSNSLPDVLFDAATITKFKMKNFAENKRVVLKKLNHANRFAIFYRSPITIPKLHLSSIKMIGFYYVSFGSSTDLPMQLRYKMFLSDANGDLVPIAF